MGPSRNIRLVFIAAIIAIHFVAINSSVSAKAKCNERITDLKELVNEPKEHKGRRVNIEGKFHSYSTLSLDYPKAMRSSKDYIGIVLSRPDFEEIPLVELKLAIPIKDFKKDDELTTIEHGDLIRLRGSIFAVALGEPWMDIHSIDIIEKVEEEES